MNQPIINMFRKTLIPIISFITIFSCSKNESVNDTSIELENESKYGTSADVASPLIFRTFTEEGDVNFYGTKNNDGTAISVDYVTVELDEFEEPVLIELFENGNLKSISSPNGEYINIEWLSDTELKIHAVAENGDQVKFKTDLNVPIQEGDDITFYSKNGSSKSNKSSVSGVTNMNVKLKLDGQPFDNANVVVLARGIDSKGNFTNHSYEARAKTIENGVFSFSIQKPRVEGINFGAVCSSAESVLNGLCVAIDPIVDTPGGIAISAEYTTWLCSQIGLAFNAAGLPVYATCEVLTKSLILYCKTLGASPTKGAPSIASEICKTIKSVLPKQYRITARVLINGGGVYKLDASKDQNVSGPFEDIVFELPEDEIFKIYAGLYNGYWSGTTTQAGWFTGNLNTYNTGIWINIDENGDVLYNQNSRLFSAEYGGGIIEKGPKLFGIIHKDYGNGNLTDIMFQDVPIDNIGGAYSIEIDTTEDWNGPLFDPGQSLSVSKTYSLKKSTN